MKLLVSESAPSNIALIKYMGKAPGESKNNPTNASISYTLPELLTFVEIWSDSDSDSCFTSDSDSDSGSAVVTGSGFENVRECAVEGARWEPLVREDLFPTKLSEKGRARYLAHFESLRRELGFRGNVVIKSGNNFPSDCGLASSASSFAALTLAAGALAELQGRPKVSREHLAKLSRQGSGSSCRSFFGPWARWDQDGTVSSVEALTGSLLHMVVVAEGTKKSVSSSEAHQRVTTSALFAGRPERAEKRLSDFILALKHDRWAEAFQISWAEFWDMHALFETSNPAFGYFEPGTMRILKTITNIWQTEKDGPLVTMDAGPNVHLLFRRDQLELFTRIEDELKNTFQVFGSKRSEPALSVEVRT